MTEFKKILGVGTSALGISVALLSGASAQVEDDLSNASVTTARGLATTGADAQGRLRNHLRREGLSEDAIDTLVLTR